MAGGGGLISLPAFLASGLDPYWVLGTNKLSASIGTFASTMNYQRKHPTPWRAFLPVIAVSLAGSFLGARLASLYDPRLLRYLMLAVLPLVALFVYSRHDFGAADRSAALSRKSLLARQAGLALPVGAYDGFFGPGTGTVLALGFTRFCGFNLLEATARAKVLNLASNVAALAAFLLAGRVRIGLGLALGAVGVAGNLAGSHLGLRGGAKAIRPAILLVCAGLFAKILWDVL